MKIKNCVSLLCVCIVIATQSGVGVASSDNANGKTVEKLKSTETSAANKILDSASMATVGVGAMQTTSALAEKSADDVAEQDMRAYLATFRCDYGMGRNIVGGETNIQLPVATELIQYVTEYKQLAASLKSDKNALGITPGIESDVVFDSATTGLYDDVGIGTQKGAFTSLSRALMDGSGADAVAWQAQKDSVSQKLQTGLNITGVGIIGSVAGNALIQAAGDGKLKNIFSRGVDANAGVSGTSGTGNPSNYFGNGNAGGNGGASGVVTDDVDVQINRAIMACNTLRSDITGQADDLYNQLLTVQTDAQSAEIDVTAIETAVTNADTARAAIATALGAADTALGAAQKLTKPDVPECDAEKPDAPNKEEYKNDNPDDDGGAYDEDSYKQAQDDYKDNLKEYESALKECQKADEAYKKELQKVVADASRHADEAERQLNLARTELGRIQTALSNAQAAKARGEKQKQDAAAKEAAEQQAAEELQQQISDRADTVTSVVADAQKYYDAARDIYNQINSLIVLDDSEADAQDQVDALKESADDDIGKAQTALEGAEKQVKVATNASTIKEADSAVTEARRQTEIIHGRNQALTDILQKIKDAKSDAKEKYLAAQAQEDSEESEEEIQEE